MRTAARIRKVDKLGCVNTVGGITRKLIRGKYIVQNCINHGKRPLMNLEWVFKMVYSILYRIIIFVVSIPLKFKKKCSNKDNIDYHTDIMFVQGAFVLPPDRYPMKFFWNNISNKSMSSPIMGPVSSIEERAIQLFNSIDRSNTTNLKLISHSAGCNTVLKLIEYLHYHHCGMIKEGLVDSEMEIDDLLSNINYQIIFFEPDGSPVYITPAFIKKIALVSPPLAGVELLNNYPTSGNKLGVESLALATAHLVQVVVGEKAMLCLDNVNDRLQHIRHGNSIFKSLTPDNARVSSLVGLKICELYNIDIMRVITHHSYSIKDNEYVKPDSHPVLAFYILLGVNKGKHDGLTSVDSQTYMLNCNCKYTGDVYECGNCKTIYADIDHFCISIGSTTKEIDVSQRVWSKVMKYIESE